MAASRTTAAAAVVTAVMATAVAVLAATVVMRVVDAREPDRTIRVSGEGIAIVAPDHATVRATAEGRHADSKAALDAANDRMERVLDAMRELGIDDDDLSTTAVRTHRQIERRGEPGDWVASITLTVEIDDLDLVGAVLGAASDAGAQQIDGPAYTVRDSSKAYEKALTEAMDDARDKAQAIARRSGTSVGDVRTVVEGQTARPQYAAQTTMARAEGAVDSDLAVTPGEREQVRATVTVMWDHDD